MIIKNTLVTASVVFVTVAAAMVFVDYIDTKDAEPAMTSAQGEKILKELTALRIKLEEVEKRLPAKRRAISS